MKADINYIVQQVHTLRTILVQVGTGQRRIEDADSEYGKVRAELSSNLKTLGINDPNTFHSLWDWYGYWKKNGLSSYQSRREYVSALYKPVLEKLEKQNNAKAGHQPENYRDQSSFSRRYGYVHEKQQKEITIREDAPQELRNAIVEIALLAGWDYDELLNLACWVGKEPWELPVPQEAGKSSRGQLWRIVFDWEWYKVYDFVERIYAVMKNERLQRRPEEEFERLVNEYFNHTGVGWQLRNGEVLSRGPEALESTLTRVLSVTAEAGLETGHREIHEAILDLSRRPKPDLTGAIQHAIAALECVARSASGDSNSTLGKLLERTPGLVPKPLDSAVGKIWGYASEQARHLQEGQELSREEAELIVGIAAALVTYLSAKLPSC